MGQTEKSVTDAVQVLIIAMCIAIVVMIFIRMEESTARRVVLESNKCWEQGKRAALIHGEVQCR
jgi:hypothetical protein